MSRDNSSPGGEEAVFQSASIEDPWRQDVSPGLQSGGSTSDQMTGEESDTSGGEAGQEYEEMASGTNDLSCSANQSPRSTTGSNSTSSKSLRSSVSGLAGHRTEGRRSSERAGPGRGRAHTEMMITLAEMKKRLPSEKRICRKASTVEALHYALNCVKQVQANGEYYKLLMRNCQEERPDAPLCTLEELERVMSEHALKNTDSFLVVLSLASGRVLSASERAPSILCCKRKFLESAKFVELLFHQDVNVFYSHTAQPHLLPCCSSHTAAVLFECAQVKSFLCRIRGGKDRDGEMRYNPFRITPYLLKVQGAGGVEEEPCCLALAERITSGYGAPRIPMDKRIFTTTHSTGCVFLDVDDGAVPLLGYLPQDLIGTSLLTCVHQEDRPLMVSMHLKVLKYAGQSPFEHSPVRLRCQNGDYVTLDTSWSSYIHPWSRKVACIIGRHKVITSPLNEDVFSADTKDHLPVTHQEIKGLQAKIYKLFLQPIHKHGSSGYGSLGSTGSHEHYISVASSSDSNGNLWEYSHREPMTTQQICADANKVERRGQQVQPDSSNKMTPLEQPVLAPRPPAASTNQIRDHEGTRKRTHTPSYQQLNCVDNIIRFLESCTGPALKRPMATCSSLSSSTSEKDKPAEATDAAQAGSDAVVVVSDSRVIVGSAAAAVVGAALTDITTSTEAWSMSVVSATSPCSYSSTVVHAPQPESEVTAPEDAPTGSEPTDAPARPRPGPAAEELRPVGLTKEALSAHTEKEEQRYVDRFRHRIRRSPYRSYLQQDDGSAAHSQQPGDNTARPVSATEREGLNRSRTGKPEHKRPQGSSDSHASPTGPPRPGPDSSWLSSEASQPQMGAPYSQTSQLQAPYFHIMQPGPQQQQQQQQQQQPPAMLAPEQGQPSYDLHILQPGQSHADMQPIHNYQNIQNFACMQTTVQPQSISPFMTPVMAVLLPNYPTFGAGYPTIYSPALPAMLPQAPFTVGGFAPAVAPFPQPQYQTQPISQPQLQPPTVPLLCSSIAGSSAVEEEVEEEEEEEETGPTALFSSSRSSSPLQLNLLQEELPKPSKVIAKSRHQHPVPGGDAPSGSGNHDDASTTSELLDLLLLLQEDPRSGTGSNASGSGSGGSGGSPVSGSGSDGTSASHAGSSNGGAMAAEHQRPLETRAEDPLWSMIQRTPERVMMTYQIRTRDQQQVLAEDLEKLRVMQPLQPWFTQEQREELANVHPWVQQHTVPPEIDTQGCVSCSPRPGMARSSRPPVTDGSSPLESPKKDFSAALDI